MGAGFSYLDELNPEQRKAVEAINGPVLILAGAGSGKTRVLIYRIVHLLYAYSVEPFRILAVTFTNKAADEMRSRVEKMLGVVSSRVWVATFHSTASQILRQEIHHLGYSRNFVIYDEDDSLALIKAVLKEKGIDQKFVHPKWLRSQIEWIKRDLIDPESLCSRGDIYKVLNDVYREYQARLELSNSLDFTDLLLKCNELFDRYPGVLRKYQERFQYIMVDEYQDTNYLQYLLVQKLSRSHRNLCVVGDEDQSIYRWRGANLENLLNFTKDFPDAKVFKLEQNYRSTKRIISCASELISHNQKRVEKRLWTENEEGEKINLLEFEDEREEARFVVEEVLRLRSRGFQYKDIAVFYRVNSQSRQVEDALREVGLPYQVYGGVRFYDRKEVKDLLCYLRLLVSPFDEVSFVRVINNPPRGIGESTLLKLREFAKSRGINLVDALDCVCEEDFLSRRSRDSISGFSNLLKGWKKMIEEGRGLREVAEEVLTGSGYKEELEREGTLEAETRLANLEELLNAISEYEEKAKSPSLLEFLEKVALVQDIDSYNPEEGLLSLMTLHCAKGLEFAVVFIVGLEEDLLPHIHSLEDEDELEEERRLFYVGLTRAKRLVYLSFSRTRTRQGKRFHSEPSRFLDEMPKEHLDLRGISFKKLANDRIRKSRRKGERAFEDAYLDEGEDETVWVPELEVSFRKGMRVWHPQFGEGVIEKLEGYDEKLKLVVRFGDTKKKLIAKYAPLEIME